MYIYKITNLINRKIYIGQTIKPLKQRISAYLYWCNNKKVSHQRIIHAMRKYGFDKFSFEVIDYAIDKDDLSSKEIYWIGIYNSTNIDIGYNISHGGFNVYDKNPKLKERMIQKVKGRKQTQEHLNKRVEARKGYKHTEETKKKIGKGNSRKEIRRWNKGLRGEEYKKHFKNGMKGQFIKNNPSWNKGTKEIMKPNSGSFKEKLP